VDPGGHPDPFNPRLVLRKITSIRIRFGKRYVSAYMLNPGGAATPWDATSGAKRAVMRRVVVDFKKLNMFAS